MSSLQDIAEYVVDIAMRLIPRPTPARQAFEQCRIIAHRGAHDNRQVMENTLRSFEIASEAGVWGIECDIRWTADGVPVILHDSSPARVFGVDLAVSKTSFADLRRQLPNIPSLEECLTAYAGRMHLMLELKEDDERDEGVLRQRTAVLGALLAPLQPVEDFHILSLDPALFRQTDFLPTNALLPVSLTNASSLSKHSLTRDYAGLGGHFLLLNRRIQQAHSAKGQRLGVGFPASRYSLFRELNRGIEWVFTNDAVKLQGIVEHYLQRDSVS